MQWSRLHVLEVVHARVGLWRVVYLNTAMYKYEGGCVGVGINQTVVAIYVNISVIIGVWCAWVGLNQKQHIIRGMTCGMGLHLV